MQRAVNERLGDWMEQNPGQTAKLIVRARAAASARIAARKARDMACNRARACSAPAALLRQARRLLQQQPGGARDLLIGGRLRRWPGQGRAQPPHPGDPAARKDPQRREGTHRPPCSPRPSRRSSRRSAPVCTRSSTSTSCAIGQDRADGRCRRRRRPHPHAAADAAVPVHARAHRRLRLPGPAAAVLAALDQRPTSWLSNDGERDRCATRASRRARSRPR